MEHVTITELSNGYVRLTPEAGYALYCDHIGAVVPEAVVKSPRGFRAIPSSESPAPQTVPNLAQLLDAVKRLLAGETEAMTDEQAIESAALFPTWVSKIGTPVAAGERLWYSDKLWRVIQPHIPQADWTPDTVPALFAEVSLEEWPEWVQPTGAHDAYAEGAHVAHAEKHWESEVPNNVWEPGVYGWKEV